MARVCKGLCKDPEFFSKTKLSYSKGSKCNVCKVWVKQPTHIPIDFHLVVTTEHIRERYYDIKGKLVDNVHVLIPVKQLALRTRNQKGKFVKMIKELDLDVECRCCNNICRGSPYCKTDERKAVKKVRITIEKVGVLCNTSVQRSKVS